MDRPNILFLMSDQMSAFALPFYADRGAKTPNLSALAARGTVFRNAYCSFPLCAPSRFAMMTGMLPSRIGAYDNAAELSATIPTIPHYLRLAGYQTAVSGKLHYVGPDQLHGFEERLTTDIYPADFGWTPEPEGDAWWRGDRSGDDGSGVSGTETVADAGAYARSMQMDYDEAVFQEGLQKIYDLARSNDARPFFLMVSFTQPHDPYVTTREFWDLYDEGEIPAPIVPEFRLEDHDPHSRELHSHYGMDRCPISAEETLRARRGYFGMISDIDAKVGRLLAALEETGLGQNTAVVYTSDHGDMMGERGLWFKKTFFEWAMRVPLIIALPVGSAGRRIERNVSHLDLLPTLVALSGGDPQMILGQPDGASLLPDLKGEAVGRDKVLAEHLDEGTRAPRLMIREGRYKYVFSPAYPAQLYDLEADPDELENLAAAPALSEVVEQFECRVGETWDVAALQADIQGSRRMRGLVHAALRQGRWHSWDHDPGRPGQDRYVRHRDSFPAVERRAYLPYSDQ